MTILNFPLFNSRNPKPVPNHKLALRVAKPFSRPVPLIGRAAAGRPIEAIEAAYGLDASVDVPISMLSNGEHFVLQVIGDSMIEDGILSGDFVVVKQQSSAVNGQTIVAQLGNEVTVKKYYRRGKRIELHPANIEFKPIVVKYPESFQIDGVVVGVIRHLEQYVGR